MQGLQSSALVQLRFCAALAAFLALGGLVEELLRGPRRPYKAQPTPAHYFPIHRIVVGQAALASWIYLRSALGHLIHVPGVSGVELWALVLVALAVSAWRRRAEVCAAVRPAQAMLWLALLATGFGFVAFFSGMLAPPSSDPDQHVWLARLVLRHGKVVLDQQPISAAAIYYPSAFSVLNALWCWLSGAPPVPVVDCQVALQACLATGLLLEALQAVEHRARVASGLLALFVCNALLVLPLHPVRSRLEGTARLAHTAFLLLPLTAPLWLAALRAGRTRLRGSTLLLCCFALGWAFGTSPAHAPAQLAFCLGALALAFTPSPWSEPLPGLAEGRAALWPWLLGGAALVALLVFSDAWVQLQLGGGNVPYLEHPPEAPLPLLEAMRAGLAALWNEGRPAPLPPGCLPSVRCGPALAGPSRWIAPLLDLAALATLFVSHRRRGAAGSAARQAPHPEHAPRAGAAATVVLACALVVLALLVFDGACARLLRDRPGYEASILRNYLHEGLTSASALVFALQLGAGASLSLCALESLFWRVQRLRSSRLFEVLPGAALLLACAIALLAVPGQATAARANLLAVLHAPRTAGNLSPEDVAFARAVEPLIPAPDRVLLPSVTAQVNAWESDTFLVATSRALVDWADVPFAWFLNYGGSDFTAAAYQQHVCERLDLPWLDAHRVRWVAVSTASLEGGCLFGWEVARDRYFDERLRRGDRALYRLRPERLAAAATDPLLGMSPSPQHGK